MKDGLILIDKPLGYSSYDVIRVLKKLLKIKRIGHTGTLDPQAGGLLLILLNRGTKVASMLESMNKIYEVCMILGCETDTDDLAGRVINRSQHIAEESQIKEILKIFEGKQLQIPPKYSAIKIEGERAYDLANKDIEFSIDPREINIEYIKLDKIKENYIFFTTKVSKGTYIRSLVKDIGRRLGTYATTVSIRRTYIDSFTVDDAFTLKEIEEMVQKEDLSFIRNVESIFNYPALNLENEEEYIVFKNGQAFEMGGKDGYYKIYFEEEFKGFGKVSNGILKGYKYFL